MQGTFSLSSTMLRITILQKTTRNWAWMIFTLHLLSLSYQTSLQLSTWNLQPRWLVLSSIPNKRCFNLKEIFKQHLLLSVSLMMLMWREWSLWEMYSSTTRVTNWRCVQHSSLRGLESLHSRKKSSVKSTSMQVKMVFIQCCHRLSQSIQIASDIVYIKSMKISII